MILKGVDCDYIYQFCNAWGVMEPGCKKQIYDICCTKCKYNKLSKENKDVKVRIVKTRVMADALVWVGGFEYKKDEEGNFIFERTKKFDAAFKDLHYVRSLYIGNKK